MSTYLIADAHRLCGALIR